MDAINDESEESKQRNRYLKMIAWLEQQHWTEFDVLVTVGQIAAALTTVIAAENKYDINSSIAWFQSQFESSVKNNLSLILPTVNETIN